MSEEKKVPVEPYYIIRLANGELGIMHRIHSNYFLWTVSEGDVIVYGDFTVIEGPMALDTSLRKLEQLRRQEAQ